MKNISILFSFISIAIILLVVTSNINWGKDSWKGALESDAKGYYAYLPAIFIYEDLNFGFLEDIETKYEQTHLYYEYRNNAHGVLVNKYFGGVAVLQLPFFLGAHAITYLAGGDLDGYSKWYMLAISLCSWFYHLVGLYFLLRLFQLYQLKNKVIITLLFAVSFGTHLFVYTIVEAGMSHLYSFFLFVAFLYFAKKYMTLGALKTLLPLSVTLGLIVLCRPINGLLLLFIPFLADSTIQLKQRFIQSISSFKRVIIIVLPFFAIVSLQLVYYKLATGNFFVDSYGEEGFNFLNPEWFNFLFSYKKGLFLYTPILLISACSIPFIRMLSLFQKVSWFSAMAITVYIFSSWWMWFYGGSFSARVMVEYIPVFMLPFGMFLNQLNIKKWRLTLALIVVLVAVCQVQSYQYRYYEIHYSDMNQERYWDVFLLRNRF